MQGHVGETAQNALRAKAFHKAYVGDATACRSQPETSGLMLELEKKLFPNSAFSEGFRQNYPRLWKNPMAFTRLKPNTENAGFRKEQG